MTIIFLLIGISLMVALFFLASFIWSVKSGQYEDEYTPSVRMLFDGNSLPKKETPGKKNKLGSVDLGITKEI